MDTRNDIAWIATLALKLLLLIVPLAIGLTWGTVFDDAAYVTFRFAHNLATGGSLVYDASLNDHPQSPLYALVLGLPAILEIPLPQASLIISALGWGATALAVYSLCQATYKSIAATAAAALVAFSPTFMPALGTEISWVIALAWTAATLSEREQWGPQTGVLALMLSLRFELSTLAIAIFLLSLRWIKQHRFPLKPGLILMGVALAWGILAVLGFASPLSFPSLTIIKWLHAVEQILGTSEFYWLFLPAIGVGLFTLRISRKNLWGGLLWVAATILSGDAIAGTMMVTLGLVLAGLGIGLVSRITLIRTRAREHPEPDLSDLFRTAAEHRFGKDSPLNRFKVLARMPDSALRIYEKSLNLHRLTLVIGVISVISSPLIIAQASSLLSLYRFRPTAQQAIENRAADWLRDHSEPTATLLSSARVGFLANRSAITWDGGANDTTKFAALVEALVKSPPDYCALYRGLHWDRMRRTGWFRDDYTSVLTLSSPHDATASLTIWRYAHAEKPQPVEATFGDRIKLVSFAAADSLTSGQTLDVRLYWKAQQPLEEDYIAFVHLLDANGELAASHDGPPRSGESPTGTWFPGDVVPDVHRVALEPDTPAGVYQLWVGIYTWPDIERLPVKDREGIEQINQTLFLHTIKVHSSDRLQ
jgi:hypothetical protein